MRTKKRNWLQSDIRETHRLNNWKSFVFPTIKEPRTNPEPNYQLELKDIATNTNSLFCKQK